MTGAPGERSVGAPRAAHGAAASEVQPGKLSALLRDLARAPSAPDEGELVPLPPPGTTIGRFRLLRELGRGGFGVVYEAEDTELHRPVAFKLVRPGRLRPDADLQREAEVIARFSHPNLITLFDLGRSEHGPYLVLELLRGQTLQARLDRGTLSPREAKRLAVEIARGLAHAHARSVVHRDLKPSNVFLCDDGRVKLLDFGLSHVFGRAGREGGTPAYMAPEQWRGEDEDERTDVFALGVVLFRAISGTLPFQDREGAEVRSSRPAPPLQAPASPALAALVGRMLEKAPADRPRDGGVVLDGLLSLEAEADGSVAPHRGPRTRRALALASLPVALLLAGLLAARQWPQREPSPRRVRTIAVLPFESTGDTGPGYLGEGLAEDIANLLVRVGELRVAASATSLLFRGRAEEMAALADRLRVDLLLQGGVRRDQGRLRVAAELVDPRGGVRVWSQVYDRDEADVLAVQRDVARRVAAALEVVLSRASERLLDVSPRVNVAAYDAYLRGREALRRPITRESLELAAGLFSEAIATDPGLAQAHAGLCDARLEAYAKGRSAEQFALARAACQVALDRDPDSAVVRVALGNLHLAAGKADEAEREFRLALQGAGTGAEAWVGLAGVAGARGQAAAAEAAFAEAERIDPADWRSWQQHGQALFGRGLYAEAATRFREVLRLTPENANALNNLGAALYLGDRPEEATSAYRRSLELAPSSAAHSNLGTALFYSGRFDEAAGSYAAAVRLGPDDYLLWGNLGDACTFAPGRQPEANRGYRRAVELVQAHLRVNPGDAEALAELARFQARLGLPRQARLARQEALRRAPGNVYVQYNSAVAAAQLGERDEALVRLEQAVARGYPRALLRRDPAFRSLAEAERFRGLVAPGAAAPHPE